MQIQTVNSYCAPGVFASQQAANIVFYVAMNVFDIVRKSELMRFLGSSSG